MCGSVQDPWRGSQKTDLSSFCGLKSCCKSEFSRHALPGWDFQFGPQLWTQVVSGSKFVCGLGDPIRAALPSRQPEVSGVARAVGSEPGLRATDGFVLRVGCI